MSLMDILGGVAGSLGGVAGSFQPRRPSEQNAGFTILDIRVPAAESCHPAPDFGCPSCGWKPLAWRDWETGGRKMRDLRCRECGWSQSGTV